MKTALTYDDINLVPSYSDIESRQKIDISTNFTKNYRLKIPFVASPMDTVCDSEMAIAMAELGAVGIIHRFMTIGEQEVEISRLMKALSEKGLYEDWESLELVIFLLLLQLEQTEIILNALRH